jgi:hypothetical protein
LDFLSFSYSRNTRISLPSELIFGSRYFYQRKTVFAAQIPVYNFSEIDQPVFKSIAIHR